jgi:hypothetical protein
MTLGFLPDWTLAGAGSVHQRLLLRRWLAGQEVDDPTTRPSSPFPASLIAQLPRIANELDDPCN